MKKTRSAAGQRCQKIGNALYLAAFAVFLVYMFLSTTMIPYQRFRPENLDRKIGMLALFAVGFQIAAAGSDAGAVYPEGGNIPGGRKRGEIRKYICLFLIGGTMFYSWLTYPQGMLFPIAVFLIGAPFTGSRKILRTYLAVEVPLTVITIAAALAGLIENLIYHQESHGYTTRISFGFIYPTDFCAHLLFLALVWVWLRGRKIRIWEMALIAAETFVSYRLCYARTTTMLLVLLLVGILLQKIGSRRAGKRQKTEPHAADGTKEDQRAKKGKRKHGSGLLHGLAGVYAFWIAPLIAAVSVCSAYFFRADSGFLGKINSVMTGRLRYGQIGIEKYGIRPWGTYVETHGAGGTTQKVQDYFFIDNSYVMILVKMGFLVLFAVLLTLILVFLAEWKKRNALHILILTIVLLTCIMEQHLLEIWYDPFLLFAGEACEVLFGGGRENPASHETAASRQSDFC